MASLISCTGRWVQSAQILRKDIRITRAGRAQYYQYALGSARESRDWYYKAHHVLKDDVVAHRISFLTQIIKLLLVMVPEQRGQTLQIREEQAGYVVEIENLLEQIPS